MIIDAVRHPFRHLARWSPPPRALTSNLCAAPIRDRIDINQAFLPLRKAYPKAALQRTESSAVVAERVLQARDRQRRRLAGSGWQTNGEVSGTYLRRQLPLPDGLQAVDEAVDRGRLSARGVDKVLRLRIWWRRDVPAEMSWRSRWQCGAVSSLAR
jgi:magnesium chelatase family protein